jgi:hypothetical protein
MNYDNVITLDSYTSNILCELPRTTQLAKLTVKLVGNGVTNYYTVYIGIADWNATYNIKRTVRFYPANTIDARLMMHQNGHDVLHSVNTNVKRSKSTGGVLVILHNTYEYDVNVTLWINDLCLDVHTAIFDKGVDNE